MSPAPTETTGQPPSLAERHRGNAAQFLASRNISAAWLADLIARHAGDGEVMLTSSPVHGLANASSDIDLIRITPAPIDGPRIAAKLFERGHHLEVISFSGAEVQHALAALTELAAREPAAAVAGYRGWDAAREPRRKQAERIVNGVTLDGASPYLVALPDLSVVWSRAALHNAAELAAWCGLAEAAGEPRGRVGYAFNVVLQVMDSLLSWHGDVCTARKWCLLRWQRFRADGCWRDSGAAELAAETDQARALVAGYLTPDRGPLAARHARLVSATAAVTGAAARLSVSVRPAPGVRYQPFLPGSGLLFGPRAAIPAGAPGGCELPPTELSDLVELEKPRAAALLAATRSGAAELTITYHSA